jgi:tetratricopeptide (TPR) repeat protein
MNKSLVAMVLMSAAVATGQEAAPPPPAQSAAPQGQAQPQAQKKEIKDPAEYNAYVGAVQQQDANAKISGLEAFLTQYPNSVMKEDALELLMSTYQQAGNPAKVVDTMQRVLQVNPNNLKALVLCAFNKRAMAEANQNPQQNLTEGAQCGERGLQAAQTAPKPDGMSDADFDKFKAQTSIIFNGTVGIAALQTKDYKSAQDHLRAAVNGDPTDLRNVYPLALAYLTATPPDQVNGLFFIARAAGLAQGQGAQQIQAYGKGQYTKYHGSDEGWADLLAQTKTTPLPPAGFSITQYVPPTPAQQAHDLVKDKTPEQIKKFSFAEWELVLSAGAPEDQDKVWNVIKGVPLQMGGGRVISASPTKLQLAASVDDIDQKRADIDLTMAANLPVKLIPKEGSDIDFEGTPVSYTASPFLMTMEKGALLTRAAPTPAKKPPVHRHPAAKQ